LKGIIILGFKDESEVFIETQFPSNICEFLHVSPKTFKSLVEHHMQRKMEPNYAELILENKLNIVSFYTGFSFRHYVGKPNFAVTVFLSDNDNLSEDFEGMMRRIAYELLPKREALNFDDIFGSYYEMLKNNELTPYWEETVEGETSKVLVKKKEEEVQMESEEKITEEDQTNEEILAETVKSELKELKTQNQELEELVEQKAGKLRELTNKYTELMEEKNRNSEEVEKLKTEVSEQYIKLEKWSQQMADLNDNNAKMLKEIKELNDKLALRNDEIAVKDNKIEDLKLKLESGDEREKQIEKVQKEKEDLKRINLSLNSEIEKLANKAKKLEEQVDQSKNQSSNYIDSITDLKLEIKNLKEKLLSDTKEISSLNDEIFDLKKEIKVLRRESEHYKKIVKESNLLP